jgi:hypothetical protein
VRLGALVCELVTEDSQILRLQRDMRRLVGLLEGKKGRLRGSRSTYKVGLSGLCELLLRILADRGI